MEEVAVETPCKASHVALLSFVLSAAIGARTAPVVRAFEVQQEETSSPMRMCLSNLVLVEDVVASDGDWFMAVMTNFGHISFRAQRGSDVTFISGPPVALQYDTEATNVVDARLITLDEGEPLTFEMGMDGFVQAVASGREFTFAWYDPASEKGYTYNTHDGHVTRSDPCTCGCGSPHEGICTTVCHIRGERPAPEIIAGNGAR